MNGVQMLDKSGSLLVDDNIMNIGNNNDVTALNIVPKKKHVYIKRCLSQNTAQDDCQKAYKGRDCLNVVELKDIYDKLEKMQITIVSDFDNKIKKSEDYVDRLFDSKIANLQSSIDNTQKLLQNSLDNTQKLLQNSIESNTDALRKELGEIKSNLTDDTERRRYRFSTAVTIIFGAIAAIVSSASLLYQIFK